MWNWIFCVGKKDSNLPSHSASVHQLRHLFHYKCRQCSIWITISFLVRSAVALKCIHSNSMLHFFLGFHSTGKIRLVTFLLSYSNISTYAYVVVFGAVFFGIGYCLLVVSIITKNIKNDLKFINGNVTSDPNQLLTFNLVKNFIQNHSILEKFSEFLASTYMYF